MNPIGIFLFVTHISATGEVIKPAPSEWPTMSQCEEVKAEILQGCKMDETKCEVQCKRQ
jgi:hypothetical protein